MLLQLRAQNRRVGAVTFVALLLTLGGTACSPKADKAVAAKGGASDSIAAVKAPAGSPPSADTTQNNDTTEDSDTPTLDTSAVTHIDAAPTDSARAPSIERVGKLPPLADSIAATLVFELKTQRNFLAASRARHLLVDLGRVDAPLKTPQRKRAFQEAVKVLSPVRIGDRFRLHGSWGQDDATVQSFDQWNGRIVGVLASTPHVDSLAKGKAPLVALAVRADSAAPPAVDSCVRDSVSTELTARLSVVKDSMLALLPE